MTPERREQIRQQNLRFAARQRRHFLRELDFILSFNPTEQTVLRFFRVADIPALERRLARCGMTETPLAERVRSLKEGYCSECRKIHGQHLSSCSQHIPIRQENNEQRNVRRRALKARRKAEAA